MDIRQHELRFLLLAACIASFMALVGQYVMGSLGVSLVGLSIVLVSNLIWVPLAFWISRGHRSFLVALAVGAVSPFVAALALFPPWSLAVIGEKLYVVVPVGIATGASIYVLSRSKWSVGPRAA